MLKLDKLIAGGILLVMAVFWVMMSPAGLTSRTSEAKPTGLELPAGQDTDANKTPRKRLYTEEQRRRLREQSALSDAEIKRLRRRSRDTLPEVTNALDRGLSEPAVRPTGQGQAPVLQRFEEIQDRPRHN